MTATIQPTDQRRPTADRRDARPLRRAGAAVRPRQRVLHRGLRGAAGERLPARLGARPSSAGSGSNLAEINRLQRRIAYVAPATAVAVNMHHYFVGLCADLHRAGDPSGDWVLRKAAEGHVFAAGHGEAGNDIPVLLSSSKAERVDGGWEFTGHKIFGSLSPVWTYLGDPRAWTPATRPTRRSSTRFLHRDAPNYRIEETWDTLGMRATMSNDTILDRTFVPDEAIDRWCARPGSPAPGCSTSPCSPGRCSASPPCTRRSPAGRSTRPSPRCTSARRSR